MRAPTGWIDDLIRAGGQSDRKGCGGRRVGGSAVPGKATEPPSHLTSALGDDGLAAAHLPDARELEQQLEQLNNLQRRLFEAPILATRVIVDQHDASPRLAYRDAMLISGSVTHYCARFIGIPASAMVIYPSLHTGRKAHYWTCTLSSSMNRSAGWRLPPHSIPRGHENVPPTNAFRWATQQAPRCNYPQVTRTCMNSSRQMGPMALTWAASKQ